MGRTKINISAKLNIISQVKNGASLHSLSKSSGFQRAQIKNWLKNEVRLTNTDCKNKCRVRGGGRRASFPQLEVKLLDWFQHQRRQKLIVNFRRIRIEANKFAKELKITSQEFLCSNRWMMGFCKRNKLVNRRVTHKTQSENLSNLGALKGTVLEYLEKLQDEDFSDVNIFNMDETPCYFDMTYNNTLHYKGEKTVEGITTGNTKRRFSVVLCYSMNGNFVKTMIIFKGLKKVPKINVPSNIFLAVSKGGSMDSQLMKSWAANCFNKRFHF